MLGTLDTACESNCDRARATQYLPPLITGLCSAHCNVVVLGVNEMLFGDLCNLLAANITSFPTLTLSQLHRYLALVPCIKNEILLIQPSSHSPDEAPHFLSSAIIGFLADACGIDEDTVVQCWTVLKDLLWMAGESESAAITEDVISSIFYTHGQRYGIGMFFYLCFFLLFTCLVSSRSLWPPTRICTNPECTRARNGFKLQRCEAREVVLYTVARGAVPVHSIHLMCDAPSCRTNYHHNFFIRNGQRHYYGGIPDVLQVGEHQFAETKLAYMWHVNCNQAWYNSHI